jgi:phage terminase large subunit
LSRKQTAANLGIKFQTVPIGSIEDGIHAVKLILARCWFDAEKCKHGLHALRHYRRRFNTVSNEFTKDPVHDFASHAADAFRGFASRYQQPREKLQPRWGSVSTSPWA